MSDQRFLRNLILPVYLPAIFFVFVNTASVILLPIYLLEQGAGVGFASLAATLRGVGFLCVDVPAGIIANRIGDKPTMLIGLATVFVATLLLVFSESPYAVLVAAFLIGASAGIYIMGRLSYINDVCQPDQRARAVSIIGVMQRFGSLASPLLFALLATRAGYHTVFIVMTLFIAVNFILVTIFAKNIPAPHRKEARVRDMFTMAWNLRRVFLTAGTVGLCLMALRAGRQILFPIAGNAIGLDAVQITTLYSVSMLIDMLLSYPSGVVMDRYGRKTVTVPGMTLLCLSFICIALLPGSPGLLAFTLLSGIGNGLTSGILLTLASDYAPKAERNQFIGIWRMQQDFGVFGAPLLIGALAEAASLAAATLFVAAIGALGTGILVVAVRETLEKSPPAH